MDAAERRRFEEALDWVRRIHDPSFADWGEHAEWLEADRGNPAAFDRASLAIDTATEGLARPEPLGTPVDAVNDNATGPSDVRSRWRWQWGGAAAAALAAAVIAVVAVPMLTKGSGVYLEQTAPGEQRSISLAGATITLNGASKLRLDRSNQRLAVLEQGEALFRVRHDASHPFTVLSSGATFQDLGTVFDVAIQNGLSRVAVKEGAVLYDPGGAAVRVAGGQALRVANNTATIQTIDRGGVGGWQTGRLLYQDARLVDVADDIARTTGESISVDEGVAQRRFSGVVQIDADHARMFRRLAGVTGIEIRHETTGWRMLSPAR